MSWLNRIFGKEPLQGKKKPAAEKANIAYSRLNYPPKIMLAWCKALEGNADLAKFLLDNGYEELFHTTQAILLNQAARDWLMKNGYPHLMAMVNASEGNESALHWLDVHGFEVLFHVADAVEGEMTSFEWLRNNCDELVFLLTRTIKKVKDNIEFNHNDIYSFGKDV